MMKGLLIAALLMAGMATGASACCLLGVQGRPHGGHAAVRDFNYRHGLGYRVHPRHYARAYR